MPHKFRRQSISWDAIGSECCDFEVKYNRDITIISALCLEGNLGVALSLWYTMIQKSVIPDIITHNYLINSFCKTGNLDKAEWLIKEVI